MLAVIGPHWLTATMNDGRRCIDDPTDWIRRELAAAFDARVLVIPILTDGATMPAEAELPADIARLGRAQYLPLRQRDAQIDITELVDRLTDLFPNLRGGDAQLTIDGPRDGAGTWSASWQQNSSPDCWSQLIVTEPQGYQFVKTDTDCHPRR